MRSFQIISFLLLYLFSSFSFSNITPWMNFELAGGHVKIPVAIAGIEGYAILDTGAQINSINSAFLKKNNLVFQQGKKVNIKGVFGIQKHASYNNVPTELFGTKFDLDNLVEGFLGNNENQLLLGAGFFRQYVVQLDYPKRKIRLIARDAIDMKKLANVKMKYDKSSGQPIVNINLNGDTSAWLVLDTGNSGGLMIKRSTADHNGWLEKFPLVSNLSGGINSLGVVESFRLPIMKIGPYELENVLTSVPAKGQSANISTRGSKGIGSSIKSKSIKGLLGYDVLKHFIVTIDYKGGRMHIVAP